MCVGGCGGVGVCVSVCECVCVSVCVCVYPCVYIYTCIYICSTVQHRVRQETSRNEVKLLLPMRLCLKSLLVRTTGCIL
jgi:hypothetical protein